MPYGYHLYHRCVIISKNTHHCCTPNTQLHTKQTKHKIIMLHLKLGIAILPRPIMWHVSCTCFTKQDFTFQTRYLGQLPTIIVSIINYYLVHYNQVPELYEIWFARAILMAIICLLHNYHAKHCALSYSTIFFCIPMWLFTFDIGYLHSILDWRGPQIACLQTLL